VYGTGSTGKIVKDLHTYYQKQGISSHVIYGRGGKSVDVYVFKCASEFASKLRNLISRYTGNLYGMGKRETKKIIHYIEKENPDVVHLHCINGFFCDIYGLVEYLKKSTIPTVLTMHAEFMYTGNCGYAFECQQWKNGCIECPNVKEAIGSKNPDAPKKNWKQMYRAFNGFDNHLVLTGVSDWISERSLQSKILGNKKTVTVLNGLDDIVFCKGNEQPELIRRLRKQNKKVILYVTPYFEDGNKGGRWVLELAEQMKDADIHFVVVGNVEKTYDHENITFIGRIENAKELAAYYENADVTLLTSKRETFSMICAESLCCGTPIIGFEAGAPEKIALKEYSEFVEYGNTEMLKNSLLSWTGKKLDKDEISEKARKIYSKKRMAEEYLQVYQDVIGV